MMTFRAAACAALCFASTHAIAAFELTELTRLIDDGKSMQAYEYGWQYLTAEEGNPDFDYYFGMAAIDSGHSSQGVFALERVVAQQPENHAARLELARGYFLLEEFDRAKTEFEFVLASNPPKIVRDRIERFMDAIRREEGRYRTSFSAYAEAGLGTDDNINGGPANDTIEFDSGAVLTLDEQSLETEDSFYRLAAGGQINIPLAPGRIAFIKGELSNRAYSQETGYDFQNINAGGGYIWLTDTSRYQLAISYDSYALDGETYRNNLAITGDWRHRTGERSQWSVFAQYAGLSYPEQSIRDAQVLTLGTGYNYALTGRLAPVLYASAYIGAETPDTAGDDAARIAERSLYGLRIGAQLSLFTKSTLTANITAQASEYGAEDLFAGETRADNYSSIGLAWTWYLARHYSFSAQVDHSNNASNLSLYDYQRNSAEISLRVSFD